jgi:hypothetical protein
MQKNKLKYKIGAISSELRKGYKKCQSGKILENTLINVDLFEKNALIELGKKSAS